MPLISNKIRRCPLLRPHILRHGMWKRRCFCVAVLVSLDLSCLESETDAHTCCVCSFFISDQAAYDVIPVQPVLFSGGLVSSELKEICYLFIIFVFSSFFCATLQPQRWGWPTFSRLSVNERTPVRAPSYRNHLFIHHRPAIMKLLLLIILLLLIHFYCIPFLIYLILLLIYLFCYFYLMCLNFKFFTTFSY